MKTVKDQICKIVLGDILYEEYKLNIITKEQILLRSKEINIPIETIEFLCKKKFETIDKNENYLVINNQKISRLSGPTSFSILLPNQKNSPFILQLGDKHHTILGQCKECIEENCDKIPCFNYKGEKQGLYCKNHCKDGMIDVKSKKCLEENCDKQPTLNYKGENSALYCKDHCKQDMIDVINKKCLEKDCNTSARYGFCGQQPTKCAKHKLDKMFFRPKRTCEDDNCKEIALYGITEPKHCLEHSTLDEFCLVGQKCRGCNREDEILNTDDLCINYCVPNEIHKKIQHEKVKEVTVLNYLDKFIKHKNIIEIKDDKIINTFCNYYRPDRIYDCGTHCVIVEIDEFQHKGNRSSCAKGEIGELARMHEIQNAVGIHCIFLRFNPDKYVVNKKEQKVNMNTRLKLLVKWIEYCIEMKPNKEMLPVKYKYLFYDEYEEGDLSFKEIDDIKLI